MQEVDEHQSIPWDPCVPRDLSFIFFYGDEEPRRYDTQYPECNVSWYCEHCGNVFAHRTRKMTESYYLKSTTCLSCLMNGKPVYNHPHFLNIPESTQPNAPAHLLALDFLHEATWILRRLNLL